MSWDDEFDDDDEAVDLVSCSSCGKEIYEDAERCHYCGEFIIRSTSFVGSRPKWVQLLWLLAVVFLILFFSGTLPFF